MPSTRALSRALITAAGAATLVTTLAVPASAMAVGEPTCGATPPPTYVCVKEVVGGPQIPVATVLGVALNPQELANVVGYLETYRVRTAPNSYTNIPCVVLVTNGQKTDKCADLGLEETPDRPAIPLVSRSATSYNPTIKTLVDLYVCQGTVTATAAGFGPEGHVIATLCYETDATDPIWFEADPIHLGTWGA